MGGTQGIIIAEVIDGRVMVVVVDVTIVQVMVIDVMSGVDTTTIVKGVQRGDRDHPKSLW